MYQIKYDKIMANSLKNNALKDPYERNIISIENNVNDKTPVMIGLAGFFGTSYSFLNRSYTSLDFLSMLDIISKKYGFIILLPDTMTSFHGNQYTNSKVVGNYDDFISIDLIDYIKNLYGNRDIYLFGKSSGGFGSFILNINHPDIFSGFIDISGDSYFEYSYLPDFPVTYKTLKNKNLNDFISEFNGKYLHSNDEITAFNIIAMSAFYSEHENIDLPFNMHDGTINNEIWNKWLSMDPVNVIKSKLNNIKNKKIVLQTGFKDEFKIDIGMNILNNYLTENNVKHFFKEYDSGHFNTNHFYLDSLPEILKNY